MPRLRLKCRWFAALLVLGAPLSAGLAAGLPGLRAAVTPAPEAVAPATAPQNLTVPAREIPGQADTDERLARDVAAHAQDRGDVDALRERLDRITTSVLQLASELRGARPAGAACRATRHARTALDVLRA